jgi:hypothetical protein
LWASSAIYCMWLRLLSAASAAFRSLPRRILRGEAQPFHIITPFEGTSEKHDLVRALDEAQAGQFPDYFAIDGGLESQAPCSRVLIHGKRASFRRLSTPR